MSDSLVDDVQNELREFRAQRARNQQEVSYGGMETIPAPELTVGDVLAVVQRREELAREEGFRRGIKEGRLQGEEDGANVERLEQRFVLRTALAEVLRRLEKLEGIVTAPEEGRDRRSKAEIRDSARTYIEQLRAECALFMAAMRDGAFDPTTDARSGYRHVEVASMPGATLRV